jgi:hypothetical protein
VGTPQRDVALRHPLRVLNARRAVPGEDPYEAIAHHLPNEVRIGGALITMVEPHPGHERAYNRWYEDDHFYAGATAGPWMFAGRRYVATRDLQLLRYPDDSPVAQPVTTGCYISLYWTTAGHHRDAVRWGALTMRDSLYPRGRGFDDRTHVYTAFHQFELAVLRDGPPMRAEHALDHPFAGLAVEVLEPAAGHSRADVLEWLSTAFLAPQLAGSPVAMALAFSPEPMPAERTAYAYDMPGVDTRVTLLFFLQADPRACWSRFAAHGRLVAESGVARLLFAAPFVPTVPGTDAYVDELRE